MKCQTQVIGNRFDPVTGGFTVLATGVYNLNTIIDVSGTFTPNNLSNFLLTTSEVRGTIQLVLNGTTVIDQTDFYFSPTDQSVGVRSTDATPTLPDPDYRPSITTDKDNVGVIFRGVNPPNRYVLGINGITLTISDVITVRYSAGFFKYDDANNYFQNSLGSLPIDGNAKLNIAVGGFSNIAVNQTIGYSNTVDVNRAIPKGYKQDEYIKDLINMFNLQIEPDKLINNHFIIEPFDDYYLNTKTNDWSEKHAINKKSTITPTGKQKNKTYLYDFKSDKDHYNALYEESYQEIYGHRDVEASNEFLKGTYHTKVSFSPTPLVSDPNGEIVIPRIVKLNDNQQAVPTKFNRRILYYGGLKGNPNGGDLTNPWRLNDGAGLSNEYQYPYAGHFDDPFDATLDINFGLVKEVYYDDNISSITITTANLYNVYHRNMMNGILDKKGKTFEGFFHLTPTDIYTLSFRDLFYHNNAYWRLLKISNYNPTNDELVKCEFQKVVNLNIPTNIVEENIDGADDIKTTLPIPSNPIDDTEVIPVKNFFSNQQEDSNNYNPKSTNINGENNYVSRTSTNIEILGDGNRVSSNVDTVSLLNSNNNFIGAGVRNVTLINSNNLEVLVSDVTYFNGSIVNEDIDHHSGFNNIKLGQTVLISQDKQMTNWNKLTNNGTLKIEGDLILR